MNTSQNLSNAVTKEQAVPSSWANNPSIYEINTWVWLVELSQRYQQPITLNNIPDEEIDFLASFNFDAIWLMGVWHRSKATRNSALNYVHEYRGALPDIQNADVVGSAYSIGGYIVEPKIGGRDGLASFRARLQEHGMKLILDYVPNHVSTDHPWIATNPEYFITGTHQELRERPGDFFLSKTKSGDDVIVAHGRDPYFPSWIDTAQLNAFHPAMRRATTDTLLDIGSQCDGVRCDMAMLMMNDVFAKTWGSRAGSKPTVDFWNQVIPTVRNKYPDMLFMAEVYWNLEHALQLQGFDFTYDKTLYDRLVGGEVQGVRAHMSADMDYLKANIRFIENHDEPRARSVFGSARQRPAATFIATIPGATLLHHGQFSGQRIKLPVQINRQPMEPRHLPLERFYRRLMVESNDPIYRKGNWVMLTPESAFEGDTTHQNLITYCWHDGDEFRLIIVNFTNVWSYAVIDLSPWEGLADSDWRLYDVLNGNYCYHEGDRLYEEGYQAEVAPYGCHIFQFSHLERISRRRDT